MVLLVKTDFQDHKEKIMPLYVIDNKKINMTTDEYALYLNIVKSYTTSNNKGEDLFIDLFETRCI